VFSNLLFDGSLRGHKGLYGKSHQLMVFAEGRIKLLIGFIQGDSDLDLVQNIQSANRLRFANTRFRERVFVRFLFSLLHGQLGLTADMPQTYR